VLSGNTSSACLRSTPGTPDRDTSGLRRVHFGSQRPLPSGTSQTKVDMGVIVDPNLPLWIVLDQTGTDGKRT